MCVRDLSVPLDWHVPLIAALTVTAGSATESRRATAKTLVLQLQVYVLTQEQIVFKTGYQYFELLHLR